MALRRMAISTRLIAAMMLTLVVFAIVIGFFVEHTLAETVTDQTARRVSIAVRLLESDLRGLGPARLRGRDLFFGTGEVDRQTALVDSIKHLTDADATIFVVRDGVPIRAVTTIRKVGTGDRIVGTTLVGPAREAIDGGRGYRGVSPILGRPYLNSYEPIRDATGRIVGVAYAGVPLTTLTRTIAAIAAAMVGALAAAVLVAFVVFVSITEPIRRALERLTTFAHALSAGDVDAEVPLVTQGEFSDVAAAFVTMAAYQRRTATIAARIAEGDYSVDIEPASGRDVLGRALQSMLKHLRSAVDDLESLASTDPLTRLGNRRAYEADVFAAAARTHRRRGSLAIALVDIDDFKSVNDSHGHQHGDLVLSRLGALLRSARADDRAYRLGGDEFAVIFTDATLEDAMVAMRRIGGLARQELLGSTISVGVAAASGIDADVGLLYRRADAALYLCKRGGRDGVVGADVIGSGEPTQIG